MGILGQLPSPSDGGSIRNCYDTFLHFLADNLVGIPVHPVRRQSTDANADRLEMNAFNVSIMALDPDIHVSILQLSLDVVNDDELSAVDWVDQIWGLLNAALMTPKESYKTGTPVYQSSNIFWNKSVKFLKVHSDFYAHYTCKITLHTSNL
jgi:hypothetical protein